MLFSSLLDFLFEWFGSVGCLQQAELLIERSSLHGILTSHGSVFQVLRTTFVESLNSL